MFRKIESFHQDEQGDWIADLSCLHSQHVRHRPPFQSRPWVLDDQERIGRVGTFLTCSLCDRCDLPQSATFLGSSGPWESTTVPEEMRSSHKMDKATWGVVRVLEGTAKVSLHLTPVLRSELSKGDSQAIPPEIAHEVVLDANGKISLEFWGRS